MIVYIRIKLYILYNEVEIQMTFIQGIVSVSIGAVMLSSVYITTIKGVNTSTWSTGDAALWGVLTTIGIVGLVYGVANVFGLA